VVLQPHSPEQSAAFFRQEQLFVAHFPEQLQPCGKTYRPEGKNKELQIQQHSQHFLLTPFAFGRAVLGC